MTDPRWTLVVEHITDSNAKLDELSRRLQSLGERTGSMTERDTTAFAWLIEGAGPHYWDGRSPTSSTTDPNEAVRFSRFEDAERVRSGLIDGGEHWRSVEHGWSPAARPER